MADSLRTRLLAFCRSLPHATQDIKWGNDLVFSVGAKMFAAFDKNGKDACFGCKVAEEDFTALTSIDGIRPAPYAARYHWISVDDPKVLPEKEAKELLRGSYDLVKAKLPARLLRELSGEGKKAAARARVTPKKRTKR